MSSTATVEPFGPASPTPSKGHRGDENLRACFPASPLGRDYNAATVQYAGDSALLGGGGFGDAIANIGVSNGIVNDGGYFYGTFNLNYGDAPDLEAVSTGGEGLPASPYVPNPTSPGPGSLNPFDQAPFEGTLPSPGNEYGSGLGSIVSPQTTAREIASNRLGSYISGRSYRGSDGRS